MAQSPDVAAGSVAYHVDDGSRYAVSTGVLPVSGCTFFGVSAECFPPD